MQIKKEKEREKK